MFLLLYEYIYLIMLRTYEYLRTLMFCKFYSTSCPNDLRVDYSTMLSEGIFSFNDNVVSSV